MVHVIEACACVLMLAGATVLVALAWSILKR